jgi:hypothetical protein
VRTSNKPNLKLKKDKVTYEEGKMGGYIISNLVGGVSGGKTVEGNMQCVTSRSGKSHEHP